MSPPKKRNLIETGPWLGKKDLDELGKSRDPTIVLFAAEWCGYCRRFISMMQTSQRGQNQKIYIVDADSDGAILWEEHDLQLVPTIVVWKRGKEIFRRNGRPGIGLTAEDLQDALNAK